MTDFAFAYVDNTNLLDLDGLQDLVSGDYINDAVVTVTINDAEGEAVGGISWPVTLDYVDGTNGNYQAVLTAALELVNRGHYVAVIDSDAGSQRVGHWEFPFRAATRTTE